MNSGFIKWFDPYKNYGSILTPDGNEVLFHVTALAEGQFVGHLGPGQNVCFDLMETRMGFEAYNIHPMHSIYR